MSGAQSPPLATTNACPRCDEVTALKLTLNAGVVGGMTCLALLVSACGDATEPAGSGQAPSLERTVDSFITPAPTQTSVPIDQSPVIPPGEPILYEVTSHIDQPVTPELLAGFSSLVAVGVIREHLKPQWSTADGSRPEAILNGDPTKTIFTPVVIDLEQPPKMDLDGRNGEATSIIVLIEGGTIDEVTVRHTGSFYDLPVGQRVVLGAFSIDDPGMFSIYGDVFSHMIPEGYDVGWLPQVRFVFDASGVSSDGERYSEDEFFARLDTAIKDRVSS